MRCSFRILGLSLALFLGGVVVAGGGDVRSARAGGHGGYDALQVQAETTRISYVVFHALDRDGFCDAAAFGAVSLHPVLTDAPNDTMPNGDTGLPNPRATLDFYIDSGDGVIIDSSSGPVGGARSLIGLPTFSTYDNAKSGSPIKAFPPLAPGIADECQAWVEVVSSLGRPANVLVIFHGDTGDIGFDRIVNGPGAGTVPGAASALGTTTLTLTPGWNLVSWAGPDEVTPSDGLAATGMASGGSNLMAAVTAIYEWDGASAEWRAYFPGAGAVPGANTLRSLRTGHAYWLAASGTSTVQWQVAAQRE